MLHNKILQVMFGYTPPHHSLSLSGCQSCGECYDFDSWCLDGGLELSGSDRHGAAAFSLWAAGSAGV